MHLYTGNVLVIDLDKGSASTEALNKDWLRQYWGGWGLAARYFTALADPAMDALDPAMPMVFATGPLCGTLVPLASRFSMVSKSPYTGTIFESNVGGAFGPELKMAGYDLMVVKGRAAKPVYIMIRDGEVSIEDAAPLWGKGIFETEELLKQACGSPAAKTLAIGPAGERGVGFACVGSEAYRQFGRGGTGALFGSKNLKGMVVRGTGRVTVADMDGFLDIVDRAVKESLLVEDNLWAATDGTPVLVDLTNQMGIHPTRNYTYGINENFASISTDSMKAATISHRACTSCPMACGKFTTIDGLAMEGPEYETLCLGGSNCEINDLKSIIAFNRLCDDLGLDTISTGSVIGMAMDMADKGVADFGLRFGEVDEYLTVVEEIATGSTERGRDLALGTRGLGGKYGASHLAINSKGLEFPAYDPRGNHGMGLAYATSERGACHLRAFTIFTETPFDHEAMTSMVVGGQNLNAIKWSMCICDFWGTVDSTILADILTAGLGETVTPEELDLAGERIWNLLKLYNMKLGFSATEDELPRKILDNALKKGPHDGKGLSESELESLKARYYEARGWGKDGVPTDDTLNKLGLGAL